MKTCLLEEAVRHFEELSEDMQGYAVKFDTVRRPLLTLDEEDASQRILTFLAGREGPGMAARFPCSVACQVHLE